MAAKNNDPAFLFYSKDFYEGTRTMLPDERACYIDLMIYQHQHGTIPLDLKRVLLYCNGINEATLEATLKAKFVATLDGYINLKLESVISERSEFSNKQSVNGTVGQFFKKAKALLPKKDYLTLRELLSDNTNNQTFELIDGKEIDKAMLEAMLIALLKHLESEDEIQDEIIDKEKLSIEFEKFWNIYNKKVGDKEKLLAKWSKIKDEDKTKIFETLPRYVASTEKQFRKNPETYLNNHSWNDEIITKEQQGKSTAPTGIKWGGSHEVERTGTIESGEI